MNPYLLPPTTELSIDDFNFVCEKCHTLNLDISVTFRPTLAFKINEGLLLRWFEMITPDELFCISCNEVTGKAFWLFWKNRQSDVELHEIFALQKEFSDDSHHIFRLPQFNDSPS